MSKRNKDFVGEPVGVDFVSDPDDPGNVGGTKKDPIPPPPYDEPVVEEKPNQNGSKKKSTFTAKVSVVRGIVYESPDTMSKGVAATSRGNQIKVVGKTTNEKGEEWFNVEVPRRDLNVIGWIQASKVVRI